jgi:AraC family transcriptional regulator
MKAARFLIAMRNTAQYCLASMNYSIHRVGAHTNFEVPVEHATQTRHGERLAVLLCDAASTINTPSGFAGLWWPTHGRAMALTLDSRIAFDRRSIFVSDSQRGHSISIQPSSRAIGVMGSQALWSGALSLLDTTSATEPALFPALHKASPTACRQLLRFLRLAIGNAAEKLGPPQAIHLATAINELQRPFRQLIAHCPGTSLSRQKTVFLRLQRIRNHLSHCTQADLDIGKLALTVNYSVSRFIRVYCSVFGETPYSYISRCRVDRARKLLEASEQCVGDIALAVGFENRATLTRAIKRHFGVSATQLRQARNLAATQLTEMAT